MSGRAFTTQGPGPGIDPRQWELRDGDDGGAIAHAARMREACDAGRCKFAVPPAAMPECLGFAGVVREERGVAVVRYGPCPRQRGVLDGQRVVRTLKGAAMPAALAAKTFSGFHPTLGSAQALAAMTAACDGHQGVILAGPPRVGKTHLAAAFVNARLAAQQPAIFTSVAAWLGELRRQVGLKGGDPEAVLTLVSEVPTLALDDLGVERPTDFGLEQLYRLVETRLHAGRQTIVTTNYETPAALIARLGGLAGERIVARLLEAADWVTLERGMP